MNETKPFIALPVAPNRTPTEQAAYEQANANAANMFYVLLFGSVVVVGILSRMRRRQLSTIDSCKARSIQIETRRHVAR